MDPRVDVLLDSAGAQLGERLTDPVDLGGSARSTVLRARRSSGESVVIKQFAPGDGASAAFSAEAAGLTLGRGWGPDLLGADPETLLLVTADLGEHPSVADRLLGRDPQRATDALRTWAVSYARLGAATAARRVEFADLLTRWRPAGVGLTKGAPGPPPWVAGFITQVNAAGVATPDTLAQELSGLESLAGPDAAHAVFSPGDICADNNLLTPEGLRMIDFEAASFHSLFLDVTYATMPFPTCWCSFRLPDPLSADLAGRYRAEILATFPDLAEDRVWDAGLRAATIAWTLRTSAGLLEAARHENRAFHRSRPSPSFRQVLAHRWRDLLARLRADGDLPGLTRCLEGLVRLAAEWEVDPLGLAPAFAQAAPPAAGQGFYH